MANKMKTKETVITEFVELWGDRFDYSKVEYLGTNVKVTLVCKKHGDFRLFPYQHKAGTGCYQCGRETTAAKNSMASEKRHSKFIEDCRAKHGDRYDYSLVRFEHSHGRIIVVCKEHGPFQMKAAQHKYGSNCPKCVYEERSKAYSMDESNWLSRSKERHGERYEYTGQYLGLDSKITIRCRVHGEFSQTASHHMEGSGCPTCAKEVANKANTITQDKYLDTCRKVHGDLYDYTKTRYSRCYAKVTITCKTHGDFEQRANVHAGGSGCPKCRNRISKPAMEWLASIGVPLIEHYPPDVKKYADGFDPATNTVYLFHGDYWHGNPQVYDANDFNKRTKLTMGEMYRQTLATEQKYKDFGYKVVTMWESDWKSSV